MVTYKEKSSSRLPLAITLVVASFLSAFVLAATSNRGDQYWIAKHVLLPGALISSQDVTTTKFALGESASIYLGKNENPVGTLVLTRISAQSLIAKDYISSDGSYGTRQLVPLRITSSDLPAGIMSGETIDLYWVDSRENNLTSSPPALIVSGIYLLDIDRSGKNFGSDIGLRLSVESADVLKLLSATTFGRLVVVSTHG
jgi:hypothetical protein